jgi:CRP-like cAMP-binding protein
MIESLGIARGPIAILAAMDDRVAVLRGVPLFAGLDERSLQAVAILARDVGAKAGEVLILEGEPGDAFYVILDGTVRVEHGDRTVRSMTAGGFLGEIALVEQGPRTATATCVTDCRLLAIRRHEFDRLMETMPDVSRRIRVAIERRPRD